MSWSENGANQTELLHTVLADDNFNSYSIGNRSQTLSNRAYKYISLPMKKMWLVEHKINLSKHTPKLICVRTLIVS